MGNGLRSRLRHEKLMITNILASVVVSMTTNVTETLPKHTVPVPAPPGEEMNAVYRSRLVDDENPREKWVTTNIVEVTTIRFEAFGKQYLATSERAITNWTTHFLLAAPGPKVWNRDSNNVPVPQFWFGR